MSSDGPTKGFRFNHVGLRVADLEKSIEFYSGVFGMKELHRMPLDTTTIVFLGYADALVADIPMLAQQGALELVCPKDSSKTLKPPRGLSDSRYVKLGFTVPDMESAMKYLKSHNIDIVKDIGTSVGSEVVASFLGCETPDKGYDKFLWEAVVTVPFVQDPDGYLIELIPHSGLSDTAQKAS